MLAEGCRVMIRATGQKGYVVDPDNYRGHVDVLLDVPVTRRGVTTRYLETLESAVMQLTADDSTSIEPPALF